MKAVVFEKYGPPEVLTLSEMEKPEPQSDEIQIEMKAAAVNTADWRLRSLSVPRGYRTIFRLVFGWGRPRNKILGNSMAGVVTAVGKNVSKFKVGDEVFLTTNIKMGCYVEYKCVAESKVLPKPEFLNFAEAASLDFGGSTALFFLQKASIQPGEKILVTGAAGAVGSAVVQLASYFGAEVTAVCSAHNSEFVKGLGATHTIDYNQEDFSDRNEHYDLIADCIGTAPYKKARKVLADNGRLLIILGDLPTLLSAVFGTAFSKQKYFYGSPEDTEEKLKFLIELASQGKFRPVISESFPLSSAVEAHRLVDSGHKKGNIVLTP